MRQSTHRTGVPLILAKDVKAQLKQELFNGDGCMVDVDASPDDIYRNIKGVTKSNIDAYLKKTELYDTVAKRWTNIPETGPEVGLCQPFTEIINDILKTAGVLYASAEDTHKTPLTSLEEHQMTFMNEDDKKVNGKTSPDICIMGTGRKFCHDDIENGEDDDPDDGPSYSSCIAPVELKTESMLASVSLNTVVLQIAVYVRQCFNHQPFRRFACAILATEDTFRLMVFDRLGGMRTGSFNIHEEPRAFVRIILGVSRIHDKDISCFDDAMSWLPCDSCIVQYVDMIITNCYEVARDERPKRSLNILANGRPFARRAIRGRGTRCWSGVILDGESRVLVVVKDSWRSKGREEEWVLLQKVANFDGVGKMLFYCKSTEKDDISYFRSLIFGPTEPPSIDRTFSRVILEAYGPPIHHFESPLQLLQALRDAVAGHRFMWQAGILHRDISIYNILLGKEDAAAGNLGVLIDLDMAIEVNKYTKNAEARTGTRAFQSTLLVSEYVPGDPRAPQDHLDDIESFLHVLLWICMLFVGPKRMHRTVPSVINRMEDPQDDVCSDAKHRLLSNPLKRITPWFGQDSIFRKLLTDLGRFIKTQVTAKEAIIEAKEQFPDLPSVHSTSGTQHHDVFIGHLDTAIAALQPDTVRGPDPSLYLEQDPGTVVALQEYDKGSGVKGAAATASRKRAAPDDAQGPGVQKRANLQKDASTSVDDNDEGATVAAEGVSRLQLSDAGNNNGDD